MTKSCGGRKALVECPEGLAQRPLDRVALDRPADLAAHRDPEADAVRHPRARRAGRRRGRGSGWRAIGRRGRRGRSHRFATGGRAACDRPSGRYGAKRLRPLRRRRRITSRPPRVRIRARNPWVRARLRFFGCQVRFMRRRQSTEPIRSRSGAAGDRDRSPGRSRASAGPPFSSPRIAGWSGQAAEARMYGRSGARRRARRRPRGHLGAGPRGPPGLAPHLHLQPLAEAPAGRVDPGNHPGALGPRIGADLGRAPLRRRAAASARAPGAGRDGVRFRRRRPRSAGRPRDAGVAAGWIPPTPSTASSSAPETGSPTAPPWPSPSCRARRTTRCSSTARRDSERPTCWGPSSTTCAATIPALVVHYTTAERFTSEFVGPPFDVTARNCSRRATARSTRC